MKKVLAVILTLCTLLSMSTIAMAADITEDSNQSANTTVQYGVDIGYTVTIPNAIALNGTFDDGQEVYTDVSITDAMLASNTVLCISMSGETDAEGNYVLRDQADNANVLKYAVLSDNTWEAIANNSLMLTCNAGQCDAYLTLVCGLIATAEKAGSYVGTLTFNVDIENGGMCSCGEIAELCPYCQSCEACTNKFETHWAECANCGNSGICGSDTTFCWGGMLCKACCEDEGHGWCDECKACCTSLRENEEHCPACGACWSTESCDCFCCSVCWWQPAEDKCTEYPDDEHCTNCCEMVHEIDSGE